MWGSLRRVGEPHGTRIDTAMNPQTKPSRVNFVHNAFKEGIRNRTKTWGKSGKPSSPRADRRQAKNQLRKGDFE